MIEIDSKECKDNCNRAKSAFLLLNRLTDVNDIGIICLNCDTIWKLGDKVRESVSQDDKKRKE
jgi:hypothetical protein